MFVFVFGFICVIFFYMGGYVCFKFVYKMIKDGDKECFWFDLWF